MSDRLTGLFFVILAIAYGYVGGTFTQAYSDPLGPSFFPQLLSVPLGLLGLYLLVRPDPDPEWVTGRPLLKQIGTCVVLIAYVFMLVPLGFIVATAICGGIMATLLGARAWQATTTGLAMGVGFFVLFDMILDLPMPLGVLTGVFP